MATRLRKCKCGHVWERHEGAGYLYCTFPACECKRYESKQAKPEKKYVLLEVVEEKEFSEKGIKTKLLSLTPIYSAGEIDEMKIEKMEVERLVGTNFFRLPADKYFDTYSDEDENG